MALALLVVGCSKLSILYVYNPTDSPVWIVSDCGEGREREFEALPGDWTEGDGCYKPMTWDIWIKGQQAQLNLVAPVRQNGFGYFDDTFLRVSSAGLTETRRPLWYVIRQPSILFLLVVGLSTIVLLVRKSLHRAGGADTGSQAVP